MDHALPQTIEEVEIASLLDDIADAIRRLGEVMEENENQRASLAFNCRDLRNQRDSLRSNTRQLTEVLRGGSKPFKHGVESLKNGVHSLKDGIHSLKDGIHSLKDAAHALKDDGDHTPRRRSPAQLDRLTHREVEVLRLIAEGLNTKMIASRLGISFKTAVCHRSHILEKTNCHESASLVRLAMQAGLVA